MGRWKTDSANNLLKEPPRFGLGHPAVLDQIIKKFTTGIFQHHDNLLRRRNDRIQLDDMRMPQQLQVLYLPLHSPRHIPRDQLLARYDFERDLLLRHLVRRELDLAKGALAQGLDDIVEAYSLLGAPVGGGSVGDSLGGCRLVWLWRGGSVGSASVRIRAAQGHGEFFIVEAGSHDGDWRAVGRDGGWSVGAGSVLMVKTLTVSGCG